ncbi:MAG: hypothetical protein WDA53_09335 [Bacillota bacterium]
MECKICGKSILERGAGSPLYCGECNAQIALVAERLTMMSARRRPLMSVVGRREF